MALWILIGVVISTVSLLLAVSVAAVLGHIGRQVSDLLEHESWASAPLTPRSR